MTKFDIIAAIIAMGKDAAYADVAELLASRAAFGDLPNIHAVLATALIPNEDNAARYGCDWIARQFNAEIMRGA